MLLASGHSKVIQINDTNSISNTNNNSVKSSNNNSSNNFNNPASATVQQNEPQTVNGGFSCLSYFGISGFLIFSIFVIVIWVSGIKWPTKQKRQFNWDEERRFGGVVIEPSEIFYNPPISEDAFLPLRSESPKRKLGFREIFSENTKRYIRQFNTEPRKRSFEKSESEKSPSIAVDLS